MAGIAVLYGVTIALWVLIALFSGIF